MSIASPAEARNVRDLELAAQERLDPDDFDYLTGGSDDMRTLRANEEAYAGIGIRARRLIDVREVDTAVPILGETWASPIAAAPVGFQAMFHPDGELATVRAATAAGHRMIASTLSSYPIGEIAAAAIEPVWFQLYPTDDPNVGSLLLRRAENAGCEVVVLTVDVPAIGNRERGGSRLASMLEQGSISAGNFSDIPGGWGMPAPALTWETLNWITSLSDMKVVLKGIVTAEDTALAVEHGVDGIIVSNHGGRQEESDRSTLACLPEVAETAAGRVPVMLDGGIRRGTDVFKALALGADAVCIGRPFCWGLAAFGQAGVARAFEILRIELIRIMQLVGTTSINQIDAHSVEAVATRQEG